MIFNYIIDTTMLVGLAYCIVTMIKERKEETNRK